MEPTDRDPLLSGGKGERKEEESAAGRGWKNLSSAVHRGDLLVRPAIRKASVQSSSVPPEAEEDEPRGALEQLQLDDFTLTQCLVAILLYMALAVVAFSYILPSQWSILDAAYFAVVTFTTIGYGDVVPVTPAARIFTCFFALSGVAVLGIALGVLGSNLVDAQDRAMENARKLSQYKVVSLFATTRKTEKGAVIKEEGLLLEEQQAEPGQSSSPASAPPVAPAPHPLLYILYHFALVLAVLVIFALVMANDPGIDIDPRQYGWKDVWNAFYYTIVTSTTIGYGDVTPTSQTGRLLATCFIPLTVGAMGHFLSIVASTIVDHRQSASRRQFLDSHELSMRDIEVMDDDGDGNVTRAEFLEFMLVAMGKVDRAFIQELREHFERLDASKSGTLSKDDLIVIAKRKLRSPQRKLELAVYKQKLLQQGGQAAPLDELGTSLSLTSLFAQ